MEEMTEKKYELRSLTAADMGTVCKIMSAIGVRKIKECFKLEDFKDMKEKNVEAIGFGVVFDIAGIIIENIPSAEKDIQTFLSSLTGMKVSDIQQMPFADYGELIIEVVSKKEFQDFFGHVLKLFNR